jgi:hypothetical protein
MTNPLFARRNWPDVRRQMLLVALSEVEELDARALANPNLAGVLEKIVDAHALNVPVLRPAEKRGSRGLVKKGSVIRVSVPFSGDAMAFHIAPTQCVLGAKGDVDGDTLVITVQDDDRLQAEVEKRIKTIEGNLNNLRRDMDGCRQGLLQELQSAAEQQLTHLKAQRDRDSKLDFPID